MGRLLTVALVAGVAVLALAAVIDALRSGSSPGLDPVEAAETDARVAGREDLAAAGIAGTVLYTDAADCALRGLALPSLTPTAAPDWDTCGFSLGPGTVVAAEGTAFDRRRGLRAEEFEGGVDVVDPRTRRGRRFENARAPAFRPDGTLSIVQGGALVALPPCPGRRAAIDALGSCRSVLVTEDHLTALAAVSVDPRPLRLALTDVAWLDDSTFAALAQAGEAWALLRVRLRSGPPDVDVWFEDDTLADLEVSPRRRLTSVVTATGELAVFDREGTLLGLRGTEVRAAAWSPDERWLVLLDGDGLLFVDGRNGAGVGPVPLSARDVAWG